MALEVLVSKLKQYLGIDLLQEGASEAAQTPQQSHEADDSQSRVSRSNQSEASSRKPRDQRKQGMSSEKRTLGEKREKVEKQLEVVDGKNDVSS